MRTQRQRLWTKRQRYFVATALCGALLAPLAACVSTGVHAGGPIQGGAQTKKADDCGGYSWCTASAGSQGNGPAPQASNTDCGGFSWCTSAAAVAPIPAADAEPPGRPPRLPGPEAPRPIPPNWCATKADPPDTGIYIDPIDDEIIGTALSACTGGPLKAPKKFMLVITLYWHPKDSSVWRPLYGDGQAVNTTIPYQYPAFITTHAIAPCTADASYFLKIQMPAGLNNLAYDGSPMPPLDQNTQAFNADGLCHIGEH